MSSGRAFRMFVEEELGKLPHFVIYAFLEWTLIALLFLDGLLAFASGEFAEFFDLRAPCVLCTRIDHILTRNKKRYCYNESICEGHKKELSSLAYCHVHRKLSDIRTMCEGCLLSFAVDSKSDCDAYKSFNGPLNKDIQLFDEEIRTRLKLQPYGKVETLPIGEKVGNENLIYCSCCGDVIKAKPSRFQKSKSNVSKTTYPSVPSRFSQQVPTPSPRAPFTPLRTDEARATLELSQIRCKEPKMVESYALEEDSKDTLNSARKEDTKIAVFPMPSDQPDEFNFDDVGRTPTFGRGNRFFGLTDSAASSPRWANRMPRKSLIDKVELALDPVEAIAGNETNIEAILNRLKNQVRMDKKSLIALYMELDEERSASAVAANNAMAMITRLQAEKAAVQMEALQYQRMMEEQAQYDQEAIQMLKEFLTKRDDEIKDLEAELDLYRDQCGTPRVPRGDRFENSQSFSSITEHGSPLFSIVAPDTELEVLEHTSTKSNETTNDVSDTGGKSDGDDDDNDNQEASVNN